MALLIQVILLLGTSLPASASGPWQWQSTLQIAPPGSSMNMPTSIFIDQEKERYYIVDAGNNRLLSFDRTGKLLNSFTAGDALRTPFDMVRIDSERLLVVEKGRNTLTLINLRSQEVQPQLVTHKGKTIFLDRLEMAGDSIYVLDKASGAILKLDKDFQVVKKFSCSDCGGGFVDFKIDNGTIWALEQIEKAVYQFNSQGRQQTKILLKEAAQFPCSLEVGPAGLLYILDRHEGSVAVFDVSGQFKYRFLEPGHNRGQLYYPIELQFDPWGQLCVLEEGNSRVQIFSR